MAFGSGIKKQRGVAGIFQKLHKVDIFQIGHLWSLDVNVLKCINSVLLCFRGVNVLVAERSDTSSSASHQSPAKQSNQCVADTLLC